MKATALTAIDDADAPALDIHTILQSDNLVDMLPDADLSRIGFRCLEEFNYDLDSRKNADETVDSWEKRYQRYMALAMQIREVRTTPWAGAANVKFPLLTTSAIQFQARSYPVIVDGSNLVKGRVLGEDPSGQKRDRADRIGDHMTWQLLYDMKGWEEDTDRLLLMLPIVGCVFRKTYHDVITGKNVSRMVSALDFVINYWATSIEETPRFTQILRFYPYEVEERMRSGLWATIPIPDQPTDKDQSATAPIEFLEQHCRLDLDEDGYPEPYVVTLLRENGKVVRITPCFDADGVTIINGQVGRIERKLYFTKYGFIPAPDGSFYDIGFGALTWDINGAIDTILNQMLDAATLQNMQGGFIGNGANIKSGALRFTNPGEWKRLDVTGGTLRENIVPLSLPGPSAQSFSLLELLIAQAKEITSTSEVLSGNSTSTEQPTTLLARIEQATKVMTAIFKRIHRSFGQELRILFDLNKDFLDEQAYFALTDKPAQIGRADYQDKDVDVVPVSDPTMVNDAQKAARAGILQPFIGDPLVNQEEIRRRIFTASGQPDIEALLKVPPPQPDPKLLLDTMKQHNERDSTLADIRAKDAAAAASLASAAATLQPIGFAPAVQVLAGASMKMGIDASKTGLDDGTPADGPGSPGPMAPAPGDGGIPPVPEGPGGPDLPPVDAGGGIAPEMAGGGGDAVGAPAPVAG